MIRNIFRILCKKYQGKFSITGSGAYKYASAPIGMKKVLVAFGYRDSKTRSELTIMFPESMSDADIKKWLTTNNYNWKVGIDSSHYA